VIYIYTAFGLMGNFKHDLLAGKKALQISPFY